jgi:hypothetical protein
VGQLPSTNPPCDTGLHMRVTYGYSTRQASVVSPRDHEADWELPLCSVDRGSQAQHLSRGRSKSKLPRVLSDQHMSFSHHCKGGNRKGIWKVRDPLSSCTLESHPTFSSSGPSLSTQARPKRKHPLPRLTVEIKMVWCRIIALTTLDHG